MNIVHTITGLQVGGAESMLLKLADALRPRHRQLVVSALPRGPVADRLEAIGIDVITLDITRPKHVLQRLWEARRRVRRFRPDLVQGWMYHGNLLALAASRWGRAPTMAWNIRQSLYDISDEKPLTRLVIRLGARFAPRADAIIYNSHTSAQHHEDFGYLATRTTVVPNGFVLSHFRPDAATRRAVRERLGIADGAVVVGMVARVHPVKDHAAFLSAAEHLSGRYPELHFLLIGRGTEALAASPSGQRLGARLTAYGPTADLPPLYAAMDILCSASKAEAFSNVIGEAMASAVPCVVTDVGDSARVVGDTGEVVPSGDATALADGIERLVAAGAETRNRLGQAARARIAQHYTMESICRQYEVLYQRLTAPAGDTVEL